MSDRPHGIEINGRNSVDQSRLELTNRFIPVDRGEVPVSLQVNVLREEFDGTVTHQEVSTAYVLAAERVVVWPIAAGDRGVFDVIVERDSAGRRRVVEPPP